MSSNRVSQIISPHVNKRWMKQIHQLVLDQNLKNNIIHINIAGSRQFQHELDSESDIDIRAIYIPPVSEFVRTQKLVEKNTLDRSRMLQYNQDGMDLCAIRIDRFLELLSKSDVLALSYLFADNLCCPQSSWKINELKDFAQTVFDWVYVTHSLLGHYVGFHAQISELTAEIMKYGDDESLREVISTKERQKKKLTQYLNRVAAQCVLLSAFKADFDVHLFSKPSDELIKLAEPFGVFNIPKIKASIPEKPLLVDHSKMADVLLGMFVL